ncbi:MAG: hypothetical protein PQJ46_04140 [Spirochaetales bacterium]|nr:hypothetical protein [Spirochaetales bacterium]
MKKRIFVIIYILSVAFLFAEETEPAILARGPIACNGIEYLGLNTIEATYGVYEYKNDTIRIYFTQKEIVLSDVWTSFSCSVKGLKYRISDDGLKVIEYTDKNGWSAFVSFKPEAEYVCDFLKKYISRQNYFINLAHDKDTFSFPAILEF